MSFVNQNVNSSNVVYHTPPEDSSAPIYPFSYHYDPATQMHHFDNTRPGYSAWFNFYDRWYLIRNDQNPTYFGPQWAKFFFSLVYIPKSGPQEPGHWAEVQKAEQVKKIGYTLATVTFIGGVFVGLYVLKRGNK